jgi:hypothetical protein
MRNLKILTAIVGAIAAVALLAPATPARAEEPLYLRALSDLRTARDYIQSDHRHEFEHERHVAVDEINKSIDEIKHAAWDDGKNTKWAPPTHPDTDPWHPMHEAVNWLQSAKGDVMTGFDRQENQGLRERAVAHIDLAYRAISTVLQAQGR